MDNEFVRRREGVCEFPGAILSGGEKNIIIRTETADYIRDIDKILKNTDHSYVAICSDLGQLDRITQTLTGTASRRWLKMTAEEREAWKNSESDAEG